jgi:hypothetical protein
MVARLVLEGGLVHMKRMMRLFPSRTVVVAVVVSLLVGGIGSATAARLITGDQIKNGSIHFGDLSSKARKKLRGKKGRAGSRGARGTQGAQGAKGNTGSTGAAGAAVAYARVLANGTTEAANSSGITDANVTHPSTGLYCFSGLGFTPHNVVATPQAFSTGPRTLSSIVGSGFGGCAAETAAAVQIYADGDSSADVTSDSPFMILFN